MKCREPGCLRKVESKGLCHMHYNRELRRRARGVVRWAEIKAGTGENMLDLSTLGAVGWRKP